MEGTHGCGHGQSLGSRVDRIDASSRFPDSVQDACTFARHSQAAVYVTAAAATSTASVFVGTTADPTTGTTQDSKAQARIAGPMESSQAGGSASGVLPLAPGLVESELHFEVVEDEKCNCNWAPLEQALRAQTAAVHSLVNALTRTPRPSSHKSSQTDPWHPDDEFPVTLEICQAWAEDADKWQWWGKQKAQSLLESLLQDDSKDSDDQPSTPKTKTRAGRKRRPKVKSEQDCENSEPLPDLPELPPFPATVDSVSDGEAASSTSDLGNHVKSVNVSVGSPTTSSINHPKQTFRLEDAIEQISQAFFRSEIDEQQLQRALQIVSDKL